MHFFEIRNKKTQETAETIADNFATACKRLGWKPWQCRCIWKADMKNGYTRGR